MAQLDIAGTAAASVYEELVTTVGLTAHDAQILVGTLILDIAQRGRRTFTYKTPFAEVEPVCTSDFAPVFSHVDWIDGESVVQAEKTAGEDGFNVRFHQVETDLASLGQNVSRAFTCLADMRQELNELLDELKIEINRINGDIHKCCHASSSNQFQLSQNQQPYSLAATAQYRGTTTFYERPVSVWDTPQGMLVLPAEVPIAVDPIDDPRVKVAGAVARWAVESGLSRVFPGPFTVEDVVGQFGNVTLGNGQSVEEALQVIPSGTRFQKVNKLVDSVINHEAAALRTTPGARDAALARFALDPTAEVKTGGIEQFSTMPREARKALLVSGLKTIGELSETSTAQLKRTLELAGVKVTRGEVAKWQANARVMVGMR